MRDTTPIPISRVLDLNIGRFPILACVSVRNQPDALNESVVLCWREEDGAFITWRAYNHPDTMEHTAMAGDYFAGPTGRYACLKEAVADFEARTRG